MNQTDQDITVQADQLHAFAYTLYEKAGVGQEDARLMADLQVETDLRGVHSHGTRMAPSYIREILDGRMKARPKVPLFRKHRGLLSLMGMPVSVIHRPLWR
jgi:ureidoglycolate dehydrogenase (NAD+)